MNRCRPTILALAIAVSLSPLAAPAADAPDYLTQIKPLLRGRCFSCHGALKQESGLRLDTTSFIQRGGDSGAAVTKGKPGESLILSRVTSTDPDVRMPPAQESEPLSEKQIALLRAWIEAGAPAPADEKAEADPREHWAFQPVKRPTVPKEKSEWGRNPIDAFLTRRHRENGLTPQKEASRVLLLRRLSFDLIGLPPTLEEIETALTDKSEDWYERQVKRLLDDPRYGERWGRHWMDVWRYSDWWGLGQQLRNSQKHIWHWRDWIVESLNEDVSYDEMVRLQLAADELHPGDLDKLRATGFLARNWFLFNRPQWMDETVEHVSKGFLGLTMNCARCHAHKYDPIEQEDYYRMRAFFEPYHVRLDMVPGETDFTKNGIPRVFDGLPDDPTYLYIRGDEKKPDKSTVIKPGVPELLAFRDLGIKPVPLPPVAWEPERQPWVLKAHIQAAQKKVAAADAAMKGAAAKLASARKAFALATTKKKDKPNQKGQGGGSLVSDSFNTLDKERWEVFGGDWSHSPGQLEQKRDGKTRSALRLASKPPRDFDATVRFTITGGSLYRSVGLTFDAAEGDPTKTTVPDYFEKLIYLSAYARGPKIHSSYTENGKSHYPPAPATKSLPIKLNTEYTLRVQIRGRLINAYVNGQLAIACETPLPRRDGRMALTTFDVLTVFHEFSLKPLDPKIELEKPSISSPEMKLADTDVAGAEEKHALAEVDVAIARAELKSIQLRAVAMRSAWDQAASQKTDHEAAVRAVRQVAVEKARRAVVAAEHALLRVASKKTKAEKKLAAARSALDKAAASIGAEVKAEEVLPKVIGARWTPTRFFSSGRDDPRVEFQKQSTGRRAALARWMTDRQNPLTARVAVNHIWMRHMGSPLVATVFDFGRNGARPTHPELLDWLAAEFMDNGWSMKHLHRLIVTSSAYRMSSSNAGAESNVKRDRENLLLWRREPTRLESQAVRDSLLALAGTLDETRGGPTIPRAQQPASKRRSLYFFHSNNERNLFLTTFDEALVKDCYRREQSIVPQQALALTNSALVLESASSISARITAKNADEVDFVRAAFAFVAGVEAAAGEVAASRKALDQWRKLPAGSDVDARSKLVWALINHNDFVTVR